MKVGKLTDAHGIPKGVAMFLAETGKEVAETSARTCRDQYGWDVLKISPPQVSVNR